MHTAVWLVVMGLAIVVCAWVANRLRLAAPLLLVAVGVAASYAPFVPDVHLDPDLVLIGLLPPLLFAAAVQSSFVDIKNNLKAISFLSVGLVVFTTLCVAAVAWLLLPISPAAAVALGAVVGPPDAVAASAVARRIGLPRRVVTILEGESLLNDATAIVLLRVAIAAIVGTVGAGEIAMSFAVSVVGGVLIGWAVAWLASWIFRKVGDAVIASTASFLVPFIAYLPAEEIHASGVVAVVVAGLLIAHRSFTDQTPSTRRVHDLNWRTIQFVFENAVFLLIGLQMKEIVTAVSRSPLGWGTIALACVAILATVMLTRPLWIGLYRVLPERLASDRLPTREAVVASWAGMRGVVTLAAAFILPADTPHREVLVFAAMVVTAGTLGLQGSTLPWLARRLSVRGPVATEDALQRARIFEQSSRDGVRWLDAARADGRLQISDQDADELRTQSRMRALRAWEQLGVTTSPAETRRLVRLEMIQAERESILAIRDSSGADYEVVRETLFALDIEESVLRAWNESSEEIREEAPLSTPDIVSGTCQHLEAVPADAAPEPSAAVCLDCEREGTAPVHLRICLECGNVGCCDSSAGLHATRHFKETGHPVMRSFEPGEQWRWCYLHELLG